MKTMETLTWDTGSRYLLIKSRHEYQMFTTIILQLEHESFIQDRKTGQKSIA